MGSRFKGLYDRLAEHDQDQIECVICITNSVKPIAETLRRNNKVKDRRVKASETSEVNFEFQ